MLKFLVLVSANPPFNDRFSSFRPKQDHLATIEKALKDLQVEYVIRDGETGHDLSVSAGVLESRLSTQTARNE